MKIISESSNRGSIRIGTRLKSKNGMASVNDIYVSLLTKSCVITLDNGDRFKMDDLIDYIEKGSIEIANAIKESKFISPSKCKPGYKIIISDDPTVYTLLNKPEYVPAHGKYEAEALDEDGEKMGIDIEKGDKIQFVGKVEKKDTLKDLSDVIDYKRGFKDFDSLEKYLNSKGYEVADNGDDYIDIASPDGYRYLFDFDYSSEAPGGRLSIGPFVDRDKE